MAEVQKMRGSTAADEVREILVGEGPLHEPPAPERPGSRWSGWRVY